jgi:hypothetical protein
MHVLLPQQHLCVCLGQNHLHLREIPDESGRLVCKIEHPVLALQRLQEAVDGVGCRVGQEVEVFDGALFGQAESAD